MRLNQFKSIFVSLFFTASLLCLGNSAQANFSLRFELESKIQEKIRSLMVPFDPYAQVSVTVRLKQLNVELPGGGGATAHLESNSSPTSISVDDVESIQISVMTKLDPVPDSIKAAVENAIDIPLKKKHLEFKQMPEETLKLIPPVDRSANQAIILAESFFQKMNWLFLFFGAGILLFGLGTFLRKKGAESQIDAIKQIATEMKGLIDHNQGVSERQELSAAPQAPLAPAAMATTAGSSGDRDWIQSLGVEGLTALLSDCYWCEQDAYAVWIWNQFRPDLAHEIFKKWPIAREYFSSLGKVSEQVRSDHHHPYYLKPLAIALVSNAELEKWIKKNPLYWSQLSPLRQAHLNLGLMERIELSQSKQATALSESPEIPKTPSVPRILRQPFFTGKITEKDELSIFKNHHSVPVHLRGEIKSLVWLALLPLEARQEVLEQIQAQGLSEVWAGPSEVLDQISAALPEKKKQLVLEYASKAKLSSSDARLRAQASPWMKFISEKSLSLLSNVEPLKKAKLSDAA